MAFAPRQQDDYGQLRVAYDEEVRYYALAPEATLGDVGGVVASSALSAPRRLRSVQVTIMSEPQFDPSCGG